MITCSGEFLWWWKGRLGGVMMLVVVYVLDERIRMKDSESVKSINNFF